MEKITPSQEPQYRTEKRISELTSKIRDDYGKFYNELNKDDQILWNELFRFANIEKGQSAKERGVLADTIESFLGFLESEYQPKGK